MTWEEVRRTKARHEARLLPKANVVGLAVGWKVVAGQRTEEPCIAILVRRKVPQAELRPHDLVPGAIGDVRTDVVETGEIRALGVAVTQPSPKATDRWRPAPGGVSVGHFRVTAGTLGCIVRRDSKRFILSNNHILADSNRGRKGDAILQPGALDGGIEPRDVIGRLEDFVRLRWSRGFLEALVPFLQRRNNVDCAIARPLEEGDVADEVHLIGRVDETAEATIDQPVVKSGRTTGLTEGKVTHLDATLQVSYGEGRTALFDGQVLTSKMSESGDSGSLFTDRHRRAVGLLFAGSDRVSVINRIQVVLRSLRLEI